MLLYPYTLILDTQNGTVSWADYEIPPEALNLTSEVATAVVMVGRTLVALPGQVVRRLRVAPPATFALPAGRAGLLAALSPGESVTVRENLSDRTALSVWTNAVVASSPDVRRLAGGRQLGEEFYTYTLDLMHVQEA